MVKNWYSRIRHCSPHSPNHLQSNVVLDGSVLRPNVMPHSNCEVFPDVVYKTNRLHVFFKTVNEIVACSTNTNIILSDDFLFFISNRRLHRFYNNTVSNITNQIGNTYNSTRFNFFNFRVRTSQNCGPFQTYQHMYEILGTIFKMDDKFIRIIVYLTKPGVISGILIAMG